MFLSENVTIYLIEKMSIHLISCIFQGKNTNNYFRFDVYIKWQSGFFPLFGKWRRTGNNMFRWNWYLTGSSSGISTLNVCCCNVFKVIIIFGSYKISKFTIFTIFSFYESILQVTGCVVWSDPNTAVNEHINKNELQMKIVKCHPLLTREKM